MNNKIFDTKTVFNKNYFKINEPIKIKEYYINKQIKDIYNGLIVNIKENIIEVAIVVYKSSTTNTIVIKNIWLKDVQEGKVELIKYNEN